MTNITSISGIHRPTLNIEYKINPTKFNAMKSKFKPTTLKTIIQIINVLIRFYISFVCYIILKNIIFNNIKKIN